MADAFAPERWLPAAERPEQFNSDHLSASIPFGVGPTNCLGRNLAWAEMRIFLARLLWAFDIAEEDGKSVDWDSQKTFLVVHTEPQEIRVKVREGVTFRNGSAQR